MLLTQNEKLVARLMRPGVFYPPRIAAETRAGEPELAMLDTLVKAGDTVVDVGANMGLYAYALAQLGARVEAFEAIPEFARFARRLLRGRARVHNLALSNENGRATFHVPVSAEGMVLHLAGNLRNTHPQFPQEHTFEVEVRTLDSLRLADVRFIKVDVEGSEWEVLEGARETIARDRPALLLELLSGTYADPLALSRRICDELSMTAWLVHEGQRIEALAAIAALGKNTTWGSHLVTRNVLFLPA